jgi:DNA-binding MarR family transcriptional regulator
MTTTSAKTPAASSLTKGMRPAAQDLGQAFKGCMSALRRLRGRENRSHGGEISDAQYGLLFSLVDHEALPTSELACLANLSPATATGMLDGLVNAGLVSRVRSERDRRVVLTSLTEHGRALVDARHAEFAPRFAAALAEFSDDELRTAGAVLERLGAMFDQIHPPTR